MEFSITNKPDTINPREVTALDSFSDEVVSVNNPSEVTNRYLKHHDLSELIKNYRRKIVDSSSEPLNSVTILSTQVPTIKFTDRIHDGYLLLSIDEGSDSSASDLVEIIFDGYAIYDYTITNDDLPTYQKWRFGKVDNHYELVWEKSSNSVRTFKLLAFDNIEGKFDTIASTYKSTFTGMTNYTESVSLLRKGYLGSVFNRTNTELNSDNGLLVYKDSSFNDFYYYSTNDLKLATNKRLIVKCELDESRKITDDKLIVVSTGKKLSEYSWTGDITLIITGFDRYTSTNVDSTRVFDGADEVSFNLNYGNCYSLFKSKGIINIINNSSVTIKFYVVTTSSYCYIPPNNEFVYNTSGSIANKSYYLKSNRSYLTMEDSFTAIANEYSKNSWDNEGTKTSTKCCYYGEVSFPIMRYIRVVITDSSTETDYLCWAPVTKLELQKVLTTSKVTIMTINNYNYRVIATAKVFIIKQGWQELQYSLPLFKLSTITISGATSPSYTNLDVNKNLSMIRNISDHPLWFTDDKTVYAGNSVDRIPAFKSYSEDPNEKILLTTSVEL